MKTCSPLRKLIKRLHKHRRQDITIGNHYLTSAPFWRPWLNAFRGNKLVESSLHPIMNRSTRKWQLHPKIAGIIIKSYYQQYGLSNPHDWVVTVTIIKSLLKPCFRSTIPAWWWHPHLFSLHCQPFYINRGKIDDQSMQAHLTLLLHLVRFLLIPLFISWQVDLIFFAGPLLSWEENHSFCMPSTQKISTKLDAARNSLDPFEKRSKLNACRIPY